MPPNLRVRNQLKQLPLVEVAQLVSLSGLVCYGIAWIFFSTLYGRFDLQPEFAGVGGEFLLIRAAVLVSAVAAVGAIAVMLSTHLSAWHERGRRGKLGVFYTLILLNTLVIFCATGAAVGFAINDIWNPGPVINVLGAVAAAILIASYDFMAFLHSVEFSNRPPNPPKLGDSFLLRYGLAAVLLWLIVAFPAAYAVGYWTGNQLRNGDEIVTPIVSFPKMAILLPKSEWDISMYGAESGLLCGLRLGTTDSQVVIYDLTQHKVVTVPTNYAVTIVDPKSCNEASVRHAS